jgi:hypothetical protein
MPMNPLVQVTLGIMSSLGISTPPEGRETRAVLIFWGILGATLGLFLLAIAALFTFILH